MFVVFVNELFTFFYLDGVKRTQSMVEIAENFYFFTIAVSRQRQYCWPVGLTLLQCYFNIEMYFNFNFNCINRNVWSFLFLFQFLEVFLFLFLFQFCMYFYSISIVFQYFYNFSYLFFTTLKFKFLFYGTVCYFCCSSHFNHT